MFSNYEEMELNQKIRFILLFYAIIAGIIYSMLVIFFRDSFFIPAFDADFNRSLIFLALLVGVLLYSEEFEVIIGACLIGPTMIYVLSAILAVFLSLSLPDTEPFFAFFGSITISLSYFFIAGIGALVMNTLSNWIASRFQHTKPSTLFTTKKQNVFSVIAENDNNNTLELDYFDANQLKTHSKKQIIGIILLQVLMLLFSCLLLILPIYDYGLSSHLTIFDLGLAPLFVLLIVIFNALILTILVIIDSVKPIMEKNYPKRLIKAQSMFLGLGYFIASLFFPNPDFRVENFVVTSGIGIEFLSYALFLSFLITPALLEYFNYIPDKKTSIGEKRE